MLFFYRCTHASTICGMMGIRAKYREGAFLMKELYVITPAHKMRRVTLGLASADDTFDEKIHVRVAINDIMRQIEKIAEAGDRVVELPFEVGTGILEGHGALQDEIPFDQLSDYMITMFGKAGYNVRFKSLDGINTLHIEW